MPKKLKVDLFSEEDGKGWYKPYTVRQLIGILKQVSDPEMEVYTVDHEFNIANPLTHITLNRRIGMTGTPDPKGKTLKRVVTLEN